MPRQRIYLNAFHMNCVVHHSAGLWPHPDDRMTRYTELDTWIELVQLLERGRFDALFLADVVGVYDVFRGNRDAAVRAAAQIPVNDPAVLLPALAHATKHLGFGFTSSILQEHPFIFAKKLSTLDHLTKGRVAWNIVTSYLESTGRNLGLAGLPEHDERYAIADEYLEVVYKLLEGSWEDDAVVQDRRTGVYADPSKVHDIRHAGKYYEVPGCHLCEPSPQRTPLLYQAGASPRGQAFAARHAECVFMLGPTPQVLGQYVRDVRNAAAAAGRDPADLKIMAFAKVIAAPTEDAARRKLADYAEYISYDGALALLSGWTGIDFSGYAPDQKLRYIETNAIRTIVHGFTAADPSREWTLRDLATYVGIGGAGPVLVGAYEQIANQLEDWLAAGVDGFNLAYGITPGSFADFIDGVVPILQDRGLVQREYAPGTLREKIYGAGRRKLPASHPGAGYRDLPRRA
ncbi:MAG TPA: LLM class flavin-dependent oxidoreductase [Gammaproteobacteria bacterium]|nr:LLM class flavin-dependent oxidoreductase [Gammaproteobacteria bacterium]